MAVRKTDPAHEETERLLAEMEKRIQKEYTQAEKEIQAKLDDYMARFALKDQKWQEWVKDGTKTKEQYNQWRIGQMAVGQRWENLKQTVAEDLYHADQLAYSTINHYLPEVYATNFNYGTYEAEAGAKVDTSFTLYDRQSVERLMRDDPTMLPAPGKKVSKEIAEGKAVRWNKQQLQSVMTQGILQGESIPKLAKRLAKEVGDSDMKAAIRNARTMTTGAQNAGRVDSYKRAEDMGIKMEQMWRATLDDRTRHEHRVLDGQKQKVGDPFEVDGYEIMYPGDPTAEPFLIYNCRCTLRAVVAGLTPQAEKLRDESAIDGKTYDEWKAEKKSESRSITDQMEKGDAIAESYRNEYRKGGKPEEEEPKLKEATNRQEAQEILDTMFSNVEPNVKNINEDLLCAQVNQLQRLNTRFGAITDKNAGYFTASPHGKAQGYTSGRFIPDPNGNLTENTNLGLAAKYYKDKDSLVETEKRGVDAFWSMPCSDDNLIIYTVTHEYGHILEKAVSVARTDYDALKEKVGKIVSPSASQIRNVYQNAEKDCAKNIWNEIIEIARTNNPDFSIKDNLSEYGRTNYYEGFAEAFANSQCGKPNELGKAMNEWLKKEGF
jgi:SPP1 gp7 family putative phage head morphogenesis protein